MENNRIQDIARLTAERRVRDIEQKLMAIMVPLLGDQASEFKDLIGKKDLTGLKQFLAEREITIAIGFGRLEPLTMPGKWYKPLDKKYTVYKGSSVVGSFQEAW